MIHSCIRCKTKLVPIVYGVINPEILEMDQKGLLLIGFDENSNEHSYCPLCEEAYGDFTSTPEF